jgi:hypothetical protein
VFIDDVLASSVDAGESFLKKRGYTIVMDVNSDYFHNKYFNEKNSIIKIKPWWRIIHARIEGR